jgi:hypothetical protein
VRACSCISETQRSTISFPAPLEQLRRYRLLLEKVYTLHYNPYTDHSSCREVRVRRSHIIKFFLCKGVQFNQLICNASQNQKMHVVVHRQSYRCLAFSHFRVIVDGLSSLFAERIGCLLLASLVYSGALSDAIIVALPHHVGVSREAKKTLDCLPAVSLARFSKADATRHT